MPSLMAFLEAAVYTFPKYFAKSFSIGLDLYAVSLIVGGNDAS